MNDHVDEEIGALLDGRLEPRRRDGLLTRLATNGDDYDVFADTAAVLREAEEGESAEKDSVTAPRDEPHRPADVIPLRPRRETGWRSPAVRWLAAAAVLATLALVPVLRSRMVANRWADPAHLVAMLGEPGDSLRADWQHAWSVPRGGSGPAESSRVAARVGALHVDLVVAARSGATAQVSQLAGRAGVLLNPVGGSGPTAGLYTEIADSAAAWPRDRLVERLAAAGSAAATITDPDYFALSAWTEAARLAASIRDTAFFATRESRKALERAATLERVNDRAKAAAIRVRTDLDQGGIQEWGPLEGNLDALQDELARGPAEEI